MAEAAATVVLVVDSTAGVVAAGVAESSLQAVTSSPVASRSVRPRGDASESCA